MTKKEPVDTRSQITVEVKATGFTKILVVALTEKKALDLFKRVRKEISQK